MNVATQTQVAQAKAPVHDEQTGPTASEATKAQAATPAKAKADKFEYVVADPQDGGAIQKRPKRSGPLSKVYDQLLRREGCTRLYVHKAYGDKWQGSGLRALAFAVARGLGKGAKVGIYEPGTDRLKWTYRVVAPKGD